MVEFIPSPEVLGRGISRIFKFPPPFCFAFTQQNEAVGGIYPNRRATYKERILVDGREAVSAPCYEILRWRRRINDNTIKAMDTKDLVHIAIVGHIDHGKSTLIGRMLNDSNSLLDGKIESVKQACARQGKQFDFAFLLDAFEEERSQGVTIDTTQIRFNTPEREYVIIDAPGHKEFVKNMVTGASYADGALLVIAADEGIKEQSRQHGHLLGLLGIKQVGVVVNKMDAVKYSSKRFSEIETEYRHFLNDKKISSMGFIPVSAKNGDNVYHRSKNMEWYTGPTVYEMLKQFRHNEQPEGLPLRMVVQDVYKFDDRRILAGRVESGSIKAGDRIVFSPANKISRVETIEKWAVPDKPAVSSAGESIGVTLKEQLFLERGEIISYEKDMPYIADEFSATFFWMKKAPLMLKKEYLLRLATQEVVCEITKIKSVTKVSNNDIVTTHRNRVDNNEAAEVVIRTRKPIAFDAFSKVQDTGRFVIVDGGIVSGGGIISSGDYPDMRFLLASEVKSKNISWAIGKVSVADRRKRYNHEPAVLWFTGLPASGKSTIATELEKKLFQENIHTYVLDGDNIRHGLNSNLGFSPDDRLENIRRIAEVAKLFCDAGLIVITAFISPYASVREMARKIIGEDNFIEVYLECPIEVCEARDPRGLYKKARTGEIEDFTGVSAPYDIPQNPELKIPTHKLSVDESINAIIRYLKGRNLIE